MSTDTLVPTFRETTPRGTEQERAISTYSELSTLIKEANLLDKNPGYYVGKFIRISLYSVIAWVGIFLLQGSPLALLIAPVLGILTAQYGFIAHELAHKQVFHSNKLNKWFAIIVANLLVGLSYGWWDKKKHSLHHANPNTEDKDPDIKLPIFSFTVEQYDGKNRFMQWFTKKQGFLFPFLLLFTGFDLLKSSIHSLITPSSKLENRFLELALIVVRTFAPIVVLLLLFHPLVAVGFFLIQMVTFGLFMGGAFAPNHKGMLVIPRGTKIDFFRRQVLTSRDIKPNWLVDNLMGGLNYQIEHHLFPSMPRPNLRKAQAIVKEFCKTHNVPYTETSLFESYGIVMKYLNKVGLRHSDPFECPLVLQLRQA